MQKSTSSGITVLLPKSAVCYWDAVLVLLGLVSSGSHASYWWWFLYGRLHVVLELLSGYFFTKSTNSDINVLLHKICSMLFRMLSLCCLVWSVVDHMVLIVSL